MTGCRWCQSQHGDLLLCAPARRVLDALYARGVELNMETVEFPEPVPGGLDVGGDQILVAQLVAKAATMPVAGVHRPVLILTGLDGYRRPLPQWVYPATPGELQRVPRLVTEIAGMAIRAAARANRGGG